MLSEQHKQAIITLKTIFKTLPIIFKETGLVWYYNNTITEKYRALAKKEANEKYPHETQKYSNELAFDTAFSKYLREVAPKEYKEFPKDWLSIVPFVDHVSSTFGPGYYCIKHNDKTYSLWNKNIFLTLLHILYNKIKNKTRGHTKDDNAYIQKHQELYKAMCERSEMQQFLLEINKESTDASCSTK